MTPVNLQADLLFTGGRIYTADPGNLWPEAVAVRDGHVLAVGKASDLTSGFLGSRTQVIDLQGRLLLPGFTDSHIHFIETALRTAQIDASGAESAAAVAEMVRTRLITTPAGAWIRGGGWDPNLWHDGAAPHRSILDAVAPHVPVALDSHDLHSIWLNSAALRRAGITAATQDVPGGVVERDSSGDPAGGYATPQAGTPSGAKRGEPIGILRDNAMALLGDTIPAPGLAETTAAVRLALPAVWASGIVAIHNATDTMDGLALRTWQVLREAGQLGLRVLQHFPVGNLARVLALGLRSGFGDAWLRIGGMKIFADGALGSRTASMLQPYLDEPQNRGVATTDPEDMLELASAASAGGLSLTIHAIGDRALRDVLDILAEVRRREAARGLEGRGAAPSNARKLRHRIEHVQCIHPADLPRLAQLDVIASMQPIHATSDRLAVDRYWGPERARGAYAFRSLLDSGAHLIFGSDAPVEPYSPLIGIHAAVTRRRADGTPGSTGWQGQERIAVAEAVDAYTRWPAYAAAEESYRGSITPGKRADLTVLSRDIFSIDPADIPETVADLTILEGQVVWPVARRLD